MSKWIIALTVATVASASASTYFWRELREEREQTAALHTRIAQLERAPAPAALPEPVLEPAPVEETANAPKPKPAPETAPAGSTARVAALTSGGAMFNAVPMTPFRGVDPETRKRMLESHEQQMRMLKDPEYRALMRDQHKASMQQHYADLEALVGLTKEEADRLLDVLAEQSVRNMEQRPVFPDGNPANEADMQEARRAFEELRRKNESEIAAVLGSKYGDWQQYQQNGWARSQVTNLRQALSTGNEPLRQDQIKPLIEAIASEQKQLLNYRSAARPFTPQNRPDAAAQVRMAEEWLERTAQSHERIRSAVSGLLTPTQYEQLERQQQQELKMQEISVRQQRARVEAQARGELPPDPQNTMQSITSYVP